MSFRPLLFAVVAGLNLVGSYPAEAQRRAKRTKEPAELYGSPASVEKMYDFALSHGMPFYLTPTNLDTAVAHKRLLPLVPDSSYELAQTIGFSFATREARDFVAEFAPQYMAACGAPMTVTSAARPMSKQPKNANPHSVHPTGIAIDIRRPFAGPCLTWVRKTLATLEESNLIEATEEHHPVHIHIAVLVAPGTRVRIPNLAPTALGTLTGAHAPGTILRASAGDVTIQR